MENKINFNKLIKGIMIITITICMILISNVNNVHATSGNDSTYRAVQSNGWVSENGKWYYYIDGKLLTNDWLRDGKWYRLGTSGAMISNNWYKDSSGNWYWLKPNGVMASNEWVQINGIWYRFEQNGVMLSNKWYKDGSGSWYWLKSNGAMAANETIVINKVSYEFNSSGKMLEESSKAEKVISTAKQQLGKPYKSGAAGPNSFDCSGLTSYVYKNSVNISLPRTSSSQATVGTKVNKSELKPGDLVFFNTSGSGISHVGLYIGDSNFIHSPNSRSVVKVDSLNSTYYSKNYVKATRVL